MRRRDNLKRSAGSAPATEPAAEVPLPPIEKRTAEPHDGLVLLCIVIVSAAISAMLSTQFGMSLPVSAIAGAGAWAALMLIHKQVQKSAQIAQLKAELARTRAGGVRPKGAPRGAPMSYIEAAAQAGIDIRMPEASTLSRPAETELRDAAPTNATQPDLAMQRPLPTDDLNGAAPIRQPGLPDSLIDLHLRPVTELKTPASDTASTEPHGPKAQAIREHWSFRPRNEPRGPLQGSSDDAASRIGSATTIEGDLELVQRKIKELADEVNSTEASRPAKSLRPEAQLKATAEALEDSIGALKAAAGSMRARHQADFTPTLKIPSEPAAVQGFGELVIPSTAKRIAGSITGAQNGKVEPPRLDLPLPQFPDIDLPSGGEPAPVLSPRATAIAKAIESDAADVFLGPIVTLSTHSVNHYEMTVDLKSPEGDRLDPVEDDPTLAGSDIGTRFDVAKLKRAAALTLRMEARDKDGSLLAEFAGGSLTSRPFLESFARVYEERPRIAAQLVLMFSQRAIDGLTPAAWEAVRDMHAFGFRFALGKIEHMGTDLAALAQSGFRFIRLDAQALMNGLPSRDRFVGTDEIHQRATLAGLSIVATGIGDANTQARLFESGVLLGQGPLFGAPRQVSLDGAGHPHRSAAA
jgi:cyclic-di-GMP phosphodiesterase TipF (flagellum assembly factor)